MHKYITFGLILGYNHHEMESEIYSIETPENVTFGYQLAGMGSRFLAALVDSLVILILLMVIYLATIAFLVSPLGQAFGETLGDWVIAIYFLITFGILWGYYIFFELIWNGQSLGKRWAGLRVIRTDGLPITLVESVIRNLVRIIDFLPLYYGVGVVVMMINAQWRRLGDLAAGTVVIKERKDVTLKALGQVTVPITVHHPELITPLGNPATWPFERLSRDDLYVVKEFLVRRPNLLNRAPLAVRLAAKLCQQLDLPAPSTPQTAETLLEQLAALDHNSANSDSAN